MAIERIYTLEEIKAERQMAYSRLKKSKLRVSGHFNSLFSPPEAVNKMQHWANSIERAIVVYDGVMTGYKLFRTFRGVFRKKK